MTKGPYAAISTMITGANKQARNSPTPANLNNPGFRQITAAFFGAYVWITLIIGAGYVLGLEWSLVSAYLKQLLPFLLAGGCSAIALYFCLSRRTPAYAPVLLKDE
jgi:hypothetical protein